MKMQKYRSMRNYHTYKNYLLANNMGRRCNYLESSKHEMQSSYKIVMIRIGYYHPQTLYSIAYVLNSIGKDTFKRRSGMATQS